MKKFYSISYIILAVLTVISLAIAVVAAAGTLPRVLAILSLVVFAILQTVCVFLYKGAGRNWIYRVGFMLVHVGIVLFLIGCGVFSLVGKSIHAAVPVGNGLYYSEIMQENGELVSFGFSIRVESFQVEVYEDTGEDKEYEAILSIRDGSSNVSTYSLLVNQPVRYGGWKIYLMSYNEENDITTTTLLFKKDPAELFSTVGLFAIIVGTFMVCLFPSHKRKKVME